MGRTAGVSEIGGSCPELTEWERLSEMGQTDLDFEFGAKLTEVSCRSFSLSLARQSVIDACYYCCMLFGSLSPVLMHDVWLSLFVFASLSISLTHSLSPVCLT